MRGSRERNMINALLLLSVAMTQIPTWELENGRPVLRGPDGTAYIYLDVEVLTENPPVPGMIEVPTDYPTIQEAINAAENGDVITILGGTYPERLQFPEITDLTIRGNGFVEFHGLDTEGANGLTVENISVTAPPGAKGEAALYAIFVKSNDVTFRNIYVHDVPGTAIFFKKSANTQRGRILDSRIYKAGKGFVLYGRGHLVENVEIERLIRDPILELDADYARVFGWNHILRGIYAHGTSLSEIEPSHVDGFQTFGTAGRELVNTLIENSWFDTYHQGVLLSSEALPNVIELTIKNCVFAGAFSPDMGLGVTAKENSFITLINCYIGASNKGAFARNSARMHIQDSIFENCRGYWGEPGSNTIITGGFNVVYPLSSPAEQQFLTDLININPLVTLTPPTSMPFTMSEVFSLAPGSPALNAASDGGALGPR